MRRRTRRTVIAGAGIAITTLIAGCLDETSDPRTDGSDDDSGGDTDQDVVVEEPRVDEPPHEIDRPDVDDEGEPWEEWNDHYLGEAIATEPSVDFDTISGVSLADSALRYEEFEHGESVYAIQLAETPDELGDVIDLAATMDESRTTLEGVDFDNRVVIVVESGFGSGSIDHRWARVEAVDDGLHLHGYYTQPYAQTDDLTSRHSVLVADRPDETDALDYARASLTVSEARRIHFNSTEGVVTLTE